MAVAELGQTKIFSKNFSSFFKHVDQIRKLWYEEARNIYKEKNEIDFHLHMISTIAGAEDLYAGTVGKYKHQDELWVWIPSTETAIEHLKVFLNAFRACPQVANNQMSVEFLGDNAKELDQIFAESFAAIPRIYSTERNRFNLPIAVLHYTAGSINSRKAMISPYLPKLIN